MANEDPELRNAYREWLATRPKTIPRSRKRVLESAERRLLGSIKQGDARPRLHVNAERVRQAQLGCLKALDLAAELPTDVDDDQRSRHRENLTQATTAWEMIAVDDIIAFYAQQAGKP